MKVLVTGVNGQLGYDVMNELNQRGQEAIGSDITESNEHFQKYVQLDITNKEAVELEITKINPDVVVHCAAWTAVDLAEDDDKVEKVRAVNAKGTENIALTCKKIDCKMIYISTDYVFNGQGETPWDPDCKDYKPLNVYGQTKLEGELAVSSNLDKLAFKVASLEAKLLLCTSSSFCLLARVTLLSSNSLTNFFKLSIKLLLYSVSCDTTEYLYIKSV